MTTYTSRREPTLDELKDLVVDFVVTRMECMEALADLAAIIEKLGPADFMSIQYDLAHTVRDIRGQLR
jgi:hypothetical protein